METFKSTKQFAKVVKTFLILSIVSDILTIFSALIEFTFFPDWAFREDDLTDSEFIFTLFLLGAGILALVSFLGTIISFLMWLYRSYKNLSAFDVSSLNSSAGWAVGSWFVPFINLVVPLKAVNEIYHGSDPHNLENEVTLSDNSTTLLHGSWWALWLIANFLSNISFRLFMKAETQAAMDFGTKIDMIASLLWIVAAFLLFEIVSNITERQEESGQKLQIQKPPQPPVFNV